MGISCFGGWKEFDISCLERYKVDRRLDCIPYKYRNVKIKQLIKWFNNDHDPEKQELAYKLFWAKSSFGPNMDIERAVAHVQMDLALPLYNGMGLSYKLTRISPMKIWASEDSLDKKKIELVCAAFRYILKHGKEIPPVLVWLIRLTSSYNLVAHDGHHRIYVASKLRIKIPAVLLEYWIDNRENPLIIRKVPFVRISRYVKDLPVVCYNLCPMEYRT